MPLVWTNRRPREKGKGFTMKELSLAEMAFQYAHVAKNLGVIDLIAGHTCRRYEICTCGKQFCAGRVKKCETCRLSADIVDTLDQEFDIQISLEKAEEGAKLFDRQNLEPFCRWISQFHPLAPLAYMPVTA